jgi:hypothetical protein
MSRKAITLVTFGQAPNRLSRGALGKRRAHRVVTVLGLLLLIGEFKCIQAAESIAQNRGGASPNTVILYGRKDSTQANVPVSIPRFFKQGEVARYARPTVNGEPAAAWQCDEKNRWSDGSLKFAVVSLAVPHLAANRPVTVGFVNSGGRDSGSGGDTPSGVLGKQELLQADFDFEATMRLAGTTSRTLSARAMVDAGKFRYWLQGPVVTAVIVEDRRGRSFDVNIDDGKGSPLHPIFEAWFYPENHEVEVGFTMENSWASSDSSKSARNQTYSLTLATGLRSPAVRLTQPTFTQYAFTRWRRSYWIGKGNDVRIDWNPRYLLSTAAYPNWDSERLPSEAALSGEYSKFSRLYPARVTISGFDDDSSSQGHGPGGIASFDQGINSGGDADWIGLANTWDVMYLLSGDPRMRKMMIENADLAGRFPLWFREADDNAGSGKRFDAGKGSRVDTQGRVVSVNARPQVTLMTYIWHPGCTGEAPDNINAGSDLKSGGWPSLDSSHMPEWGYIPYTLTGKFYYLEQLQMQAAYILGFYTGCYDLSNDYFRQGTLALLNRAPRDQAWAIRTVAYAAFVSPDGAPEGPYFRDKLLNTMAMWEGAHGLPNRYEDRAIAYRWGKNTWNSGQGNNPSPLGAWQVDAASYSYASQPVNIKNDQVYAAGSGFQEAFLISALGMVRQLGVADTKPLLAFMAKRYFHTLLDAKVDHYLIEEYVYPQQLKPTKRWVADWDSFQAQYSVLPKSWGALDTSLKVRGFYALSATSYLTDINLDGYSGQAAWDWFKANLPYQNEFVDVNPKWSIKPLRR